MPTITETRSKKILVNVWIPLVERLNTKIKDACLNRDALLDRIFKYEAKILAKEITQPNSPIAKKYLASSLTKDIVAPTSLYLSEETAKVITNECKRLNIPRDCFINRVIFLLVVPESIIDKIFFKFSDGEYEYEQKMGDYSDYTTDCDEKYISWQSSLIDIINDYTEADPFWYLRSCLYGKQKEYNIEGASLLHSQFIERNALAELPDNDSLRTDNASFLNCIMHGNAFDDFDEFLENLKFHDHLNKEKEERKQKREQMKQQEQANRGRVSK
jgi:hypothetical protein